MSARIQELELALEQAQSSGPGGTHPLLVEPTTHDPIDPDAMHDGDIKETSDAIGSISLGPSGKATYRGEMAASEVNGLFGHEYRLFDQVPSVFPRTSESSKLFFLYTIKVHSLVITRLTRRCRENTETLGISASLVKLWNL